MRHRPVLIYLFDVTNLFTLRGLKMLNETIREIPWSSIIKVSMEPKPNKAAENSEEHQNM